MYSKLSRNALPRHMLWVLLFLKHYPTEIFLATSLNLNCKTVQKWTWNVLDMLSSSLLVSTYKIILYILFYFLGLVQYCLQFECANRKRGQAYRNVYASVDGTDCKILERGPFNTVLYSRKANGFRLSHEIGLYVKTGRFVCANWPVIVTVISWNGAK